MEHAVASRLIKNNLRRISTPLLAATLAFAPLTSAIAQTLPQSLYAPGNDDLQSVVQKAISTNPEVEAAWSRLSAAKNDIGVARGNYLPSIDVSAGVGREAQEGDGRGSYETDFVELTLTQMLFDGFATRSEVERLDRAELVTYYELIGASENVALEAAEAYLDVARYRELVRLAQENYAKHQEVYQQIEERTLSGAGRGVDLEQISGRVSLAESNLMTEATNLHDVTARYMRIVGDLPAQNLMPAPTLEDELPASVSEAVNLAFEGNPDFHAAIENINVQRAEREGTRAAFMPQLEIQGRTGTNNQDDAITGRRDETSIQLVASMNLYNGGSDRAAFRAASDRIEEAVDQRELACTNVRQTTQIAYNDAQRLREQLNYLNQHRLSIDRVRGAYQQQFDIGQRTLLDVLDSENEYFEASRAYANAQYDITLADARTLAATGQLMQALEIMRDDMPTLAELGNDGVAITPEIVCPVRGPSGFTLEDFTGGDFSAPAPTRAPDVTLSADALFPINSAELGLDTRENLARLAAEINERSDLARIFIAGHADNTGSDAINDPLSQQRANSVARFLVEQGVVQDLMQTEGYGSNQPIASNDTVEGRAQNRRVEITLERFDEINT
ncbi:TolC family outer membrane protein [Vreelandella maris]|uniref:TolC family outer membrane protein n=1 Tax=Vreelandella maris TaxID=2729617 RepID=A0A7Y6R9G9_9GAMM|nr:TolC family outer membrane protein [Halomonas maris]NVF12821.1 TolC family outer membrane protein [Halomonas maris]|tara:strand:- start:5465 stop:7321 length:1857 start_codon:yes stop_codon:yes gene_type:complete